MMSALFELQRKLGVSLIDADLLELALTHRSSSGRNYERLEFLGDSVLSIVISDALFNRFTDVDEGVLSRLRAILVRQESLARISRELGLGEYIQLGGGELKSGGFDRDSILSDVLESIIGAIYLDAGFDTAKRVINKLFSDALSRLDPNATLKDAKSRLQERLQKQKYDIPTYKIIEVQGDPHSQHFVVECRFQNSAIAYLGEGSSRRNAEQQAAEKALKALQQPKD
ncbi:ribonuclease III [Pseudomonadota bacterium]